MHFSGKNLELVSRGLSLALAELHNQIATCPDVEAYAEDIEDLKAEKVKFERLLERVNHALRVEAVSHD